MSISKQLALLLGIALIGLMANFGLSYQKMDQVYTKVNYANENSLPSILLLDDAIQNSFRIRLAMWQHL